MGRRLSAEAPLNVQIIGPAGATPVTDDDLQGLIPTYVATREDLNQAEFDNITKALPWARGQATRLGPNGLLDYQFLFALHRRMFSDVWRWAGQQRRRETNMGVSPGQITEQTRAALGDGAYWHEHATFDRDEIAVRLHHRLVTIHPFPNGNGRATRLFSDLYLLSVGGVPFTWGAGRGSPVSQTRDDYIAALRAVTPDNCTALVDFARS